MRPRPFLSRALIAGFALFQLGSPAMVSFAESTYAAQRPLSGHIEDHTRRNCVPVHQDDCALCRVLSESAPPRAPQPLPVAAECAVDAGPSVARISARNAARATQQSRAPPTA